MQTGDGKWWLQAQEKERGDICNWRPTLYVHTVPQEGTGHLMGQHVDTGVGTKSLGEQGTLEFSQERWSLTLMDLKFLGAMHLSGSYSGLMIKAPFSCFKVQCKLGKEGESEFCHLCE